MRGVSTFVAVGLAALTIGTACGGGDEPSASVPATPTVDSSEPRPDSTFAAIDDPDSEFVDWAAIEGDAAPDLPGIYVDLPTIYGGSYGQHGNNATARHVQRSVDYVEDGNTNPPTGGPHWGSGACAESADDSPPFCGPAQWGIYGEPWDAETLVHNMEHGGVVVWYNTDDQDVLSELQDIVREKLEDGDLIVIAPYLEMEADTIALTAWTRIESFPVSEYSSARVEEFLDIFVRRFNPESF